MMLKPSPPANEARQALAMLDAFLAPCEPRQLVSEITRCFSLTRTKAEGEDDTEVMIALYVDELRGCPFDAVKHVLRSAHHRSRWRPDMFELIEQINSLSKWRRDLRNDLQATLPRSSPNG
jgi:hypothetical protein